jgi:hypothetical protein
MAVLLSINQFKPIHMERFVRIDYPQEYLQGLITYFHLFHSAVQEGTGLQTGVLIPGAVSLQLRRPVQRVPSQNARVPR